jgi:hypothetical protein
VGGVPVARAYYARFTASLVAGVVASLVGGVLMLVVMVVAFVAFRHTGILYALRPIGAFLYGDAMMRSPTAAMYAAATFYHLGICALWGIVFAFGATLLRADKSYGGALVVGLIIGLGSQIVDINLAAPAVMNRLWGHDIWTETVPPLYSWLSRLVFGVALVLSVPMFRRLWLRWSGRADLDADDPRFI